MNLTTRKEQIIKAVVDSYITSCEPISSNEIKSNYLPLLSSATIRNELASLEEMGYLVQPHASAGRVPTAEAYKIYVDRLMSKHKLTNSELDIIKRHLGAKLNDIDEVLKVTAKIISEITNYTSVAYCDLQLDAIIEKIKIVKLAEGKALIIIVTDSGLLKDTLVDIGMDATDQFCDIASEFMTSSFYHHTINNIINNPDTLRVIRCEYEDIFRAVINILQCYCDDEDTKEMFFEGSTKLLQQPEYANVSKAKAMLDLFNSKNTLLPSLMRGKKNDLQVTIGQDNELGEGVPECAIVTVNYMMNGKNIGNAGVIGPIRMDYPKVVSVLNYIGKTLNILPNNASKSEE